MKPASFFVLAPPRYEVVLPSSERFAEIGEEVNAGHPSKEFEAVRRITLRFADGGLASFADTETEPRCLRLVSHGEIREIRFEVLL